MSRVVARCPFGFPAAVEDLPYDAGGRPFPTLFYLHLPDAGRPPSRGSRATAACAPGRRALAGRAGAGAARSRRPPPRRAAAAASWCGATTCRWSTAAPRWRTGVGGVGDVRAVKCLHAHVAHALAHPGYAFGRADARRGRATRGATTGAARPSCAVGRRPAP